MKSTLPIGTAATLACVYEATAAKPGNVHPRASFHDLTYADFVASAVVIGPIIERTPTLGVGRAILEAVRATRGACGTNTNLGTLLLVAPLAAVPRELSLAQGIARVLAELNRDDTRNVYEAIRLSAAGGLGRTDEADVFADDPPALSLVDAMRLAGERDLVARQYVEREGATAFADVLAGTSAWIAEGLERGWGLGAAIVHAHVRQMAAAPDSLIQRKCGPTIARESSRRAAEVLSAGVTDPSDPIYQASLADLDAWLRGDGHRRNPGTTADLVAAGLFALLRDGRLDWQQW